MTFELNSFSRNTAFAFFTQHTWQVTKWNIIKEFHKEGMNFIIALHLLPQLRAFARERITGKSRY
ncbi:MAG: hypothetical protein ACOC0C_00290 [Bacteroidota bacterium]